MKRSVLLIGNHPPPFGGVPTHVRALAPYLARRGWDVHVLSFTGRRTGMSRLDGYTIHRPSLLSAAFALAAGLMDGALRRRALATAGRSPLQALKALAIAKLALDVCGSQNTGVIAAYHMFSAGLAAAWVSGKTGIPLVTAVFGEIYSRPEHHSRLREDVAEILDASRTVLSCSDHCARSFRMLSLAPKVETVYFGIDTSRFRPTMDAVLIRQRLGLKADDRVVLYLARMTSEMGLNVLLQSLPRLLAQKASNVRVVIAGARGDLTQAAQAAAEVFDGRVIVSPDVSPIDLPGYYSAADVFVAPSVNERACFGLAMAEAMAAGKPVVASRIGGQPEVVEHNVTGILVTPEEPESLASAVLALLGDPQRACEMGRAGRDTVAARFTLQQTNERMEQIFEEVGLPARRQARQVAAS